MKPATIDQYLAATTPENRAVLEKIRRAIHEAAPGATEYIGYGLAGFKLHGRPLVYFGAWPKHCALYAANPKTQEQFADELKGFEMSKGTIRFTVEKPLPIGLVKRLVKVRAAENAARQSGSGGAPVSDPAKTPTTRATRSGKKTTSTKALPKPPPAVSVVLATLKSLGVAKFRDEMESRYGITAADAYGVPMNRIQATAKELGRHHGLAGALWDTGNYDARLLACFVAESERVTPAFMDRWCRDFDSWAVCDTACMHLFDRTPHAFGRITAWATRTGEFQKRAAFALLASVALHDKKAPDAPFLDTFPLMEAAAQDDRNFVKKGVSWALRAIGRRNAAMKSAATLLAKRLAASDSPPARWIGKDALRDLAKPAKVTP